MKKHLLLFILLFPMVLSAQEDDRYLKGAITMENGKVTFTKDLTLEGLTQDQIFNQLLEWAQNRFTTDKSRVAFFDKEKGNIAVTGVETLVFSSTALSLDQSDMQYRILIYCSGNTCEVKLTNLHYVYNVSYQREPERYAAEEWITDEYALTKRNRLARISGKFRKATIDFKDSVFDDITNLFKVDLASTPVVTQSKEIVTAQPVITIKETDSPKVSAAKREGYISFQADKIPESLLLLIQDSRMTVTVDQSVTDVDTDASWKGISTMFGKTVAVLSLSANSDLYPLMKDQYTILFIKDADGSPWMIIECSKQGETTEGDEKTILGEIEQVWIK